MALAISSAPSGATRQTPSSNTSKVSRRTSLPAPNPPGKETMTPSRPGFNTTKS